MTKDGEWAAFEPLPSSFMVMAGDASVVSRLSIILTELAEPRRIMRFRLRIEAGSNGTKLGSMDTSLTVGNALFSLLLRWLSRIRIYKEQCQW